MKIFAIVSYVNWILWDQVIFNFLLTLSDGEADESDVINEDIKITDNEDDEEWKLVTTCMLNHVNKMNWNILVDYIRRIIVNYSSLTFIIVPGSSPPFGNTFSSHMLLDLKKVKFIRFRWGLMEFVLSFLYSTFKLNLTQSVTYFFSFFQNTTECRCVGNTHLP